EMSKQVSEQTFSQSEHSAMEMRKQVEEMSEVMKQRIGDLQEGHEILLNSQAQNLKISDEMLQAFNESINNMNGISSSINQTISRLNVAHTNLGVMVSTIESLTKDVKDSSNRFSESQLAFSE